LRLKRQRKQGQAEETVVGRKHKRKKEIEKHGCGNNGTKRNGNEKKGKNGKMARKQTSTLKLVDN
jgi:hypothetical protein